MCLVTSDDVPQNSVSQKQEAKNIHFVMRFVVMIAASESSLYLIIIIKSLMMMAQKLKKKNREASEMSRQKMKVLLNREKWKEE